MPRRLRCTLLCEDIEHERFFRAILERMFGRIHVVRQGDVNSVLSAYARQVSLVRRYPQEAVGLVVVVDGDDAGLEKRLRELDDQLRTNGQQKRSPKERLAACVPVRNVETWECWLCGKHDVDEAHDFKPTFKAAVRRGTMGTAQAAKKWFDQPTPDERAAETAHLPSLTAGRKELSRLADATFGR